MPDIIDIDAGSIISGGSTIEQMGEKFSTMCFRLRAENPHQG